MSHDLRQAGVTFALDNIKQLSFMNTTINNPLKRFTKIYFNYRVFKGDDMVADESVALSLSENEIKKVAAVMQSNGGFPVDMCELENLSDRLIDEIYINELTRLFPDEEDLGDFDVEVDDAMPSDLCEAAEQYIQYKDVDQTFYLDVDGREVKQSFGLRVSQHAFHQMVEVVKSGKHDTSDFDTLKEQAPEAYKEMSELIFEWADKYCMSVYGEPKACRLKEFPYQVYESL